MGKKYKSGSWAKTGRVMPGKRIKEKHIDQILPNGKVVVTGKNQVFSRTEKKILLKKLFPETEENDGHIYLRSNKKNEKEIGFYIRNMCHLGGNWSSEKKRIEVGKDFLHFYNKNLTDNVETVLLGCYHYYPNEKDGVRLYACFSAATYASRKANNSAAHVHTIDLLNALKNGIYRRLDKSNNELLVLDEKNFVQYINSLRIKKVLQTITDDKQLLDYFGQLYQSLPKTLYGIQCYKEMMTAKDQNRNQTQWEGFYIEYYVKKYLTNNPVKAIEWWSKKKKGELDFDLKIHTTPNFYGDIKSDNAKKNVQGNKKENVDFLVKKQNGRLWYIVFEYSPQRDVNHGKKTTIWWSCHKDNNKEEEKNSLSVAIRMKYSITFENMSVYEINQNSFKYLKEYNVSSCNGKERKVKYQIPNKMKDFLRIYQCS